MKNLLVVIDCQNDFIDGSLGSTEAKAIVKNVVDKIKFFDGDVFVTYDTHFDGSYLDSNEGKHLPVKHCIIHTDGWQLNPEIEAAFREHLNDSDGSYEQCVFMKETFGSVKLGQAIKDASYDYVEIVGLCTDICVISNALVIKAFSPEIQITCDYSCCAGVTPELHNAAKMVMGSCQIDEV